MSSETPLVRAFASLSSSGSDVLIAGATAKALEIAKAMVIVVMDAGGHLLGYRRMDGVPTFCIDIAMDKAHTAVSFGIPTAAWHDHIKDDPPLLAGMVHRPRLVIFGGGVPVRVDGNVVGSIGVSGGHYSQDVAVAEAGINSLLASN